LSRVLQYEPNDLTISVEAGLRWRDLETLLASNRQMIPLDPWHDESTVGGVVAANISGPRRRVYGTARDVVIGMGFAMLDGKLANSGGMVVKNVAGLDMGKLMIGSYGTLAAITSVNFKLAPRPEVSRTFAFPHATVSAAAAQAAMVLAGPLQPVSIDILKQDGVRLLVQVAGSAALAARYEREWRGTASSQGPAEVEAWRPAKALPFTAAATVRVSCTLGEVGQVLEALPGDAVARAGNGVVYGAFADWQAAADWTQRAKWTAIIESAASDCPSAVRWPKPSSGFTTMEKIKTMFDPKRLLNPGRLHGRI
jgi:glycolate oxidase FAD binding subunit